MPSSAKELAALRKQDVDDLRSALDKRREELMDLRFSHATGSLENPARLALVKREVARILTVLNERGAAAGPPAAAARSTKAAGAKPASESPGDTAPAHADAAVATASE